MIKGDTPCQDFQPLCDPRYEKCRLRKKVLDLGVAPCDDHVTSRYGGAVPIVLKVDISRQFLSKFFHLSGHQEWKMSICRPCRVVIRQVAEQ